MDILTHQALKFILQNVKTIAVVGASNNPDKASNHVTEALVKAGYTVWPVNPKEEAIAGVKAYPSIDALPERPDVIDVFRNPEAAVGVVEEAVKKGTKLVWLQEGVGSKEAETVACDADIPIVMDICIFKELHHHGRA